MASRSAAMGLASFTGGLLPTVNRSAMRFSMKEKVTASIRPRDTSRRLLICTRRCAGVIAGSGSAASILSGTAGDAVEAVDARDLLHQVRLAFHIGAPGRDVGLDLAVLLRRA